VCALGDVARARREVGKKSESSSPILRTHSRSLTHLTSVTHQRAYRKVTAHRAEQGQTVEWKDPTSRVPTPNRVHWDTSAVRLKRDAAHDARAPSTPSPSRCCLRVPIIIRNNDIHVSS